MNTFLTLREILPCKIDGLDFILFLYFDLRGFYRKNPEIWTYLGKGPQILCCTNDVRQALFYFFKTFTRVTLVSDEGDANVTRLSIF